MHVVWGQLGLVLLLGLVAGSGLVSVFAVGVLALSRVDDSRAAGRGVAAHRLQAGLCFGICAAAVIYGIVLLVH